MNMETNNRSAYWDVIKGLGIIAVVIGHSGSPLRPFVYMYHLMLFFFISGYLYNIKYDKDIYTFIGKRVQTQWVLAVKYNIFIILVHNLFIDIGIYKLTDTQIFNLPAFVSNVANSVFLVNMDWMIGAMWFVPLLFFCCVLFCFVRYITRNMENGLRRELVISLIIMLLTIPGAYLVQRKLNIQYRAQLSLLILPIMQIGFLLKHYSVKIPYKWYYALISVFVLIAVWYYKKVQVELSVNEIIGYGYFYLVSVCGIYANLYLGTLILKLKKMADVISYLGQKSFHIMALHFIFFKPVEYYRFFVLHKPFSDISAFPYSDKGYWVAYVILGIALPALLVYVFDRFNEKYSFFRLSTLKKQG
jgi:fucose 4-O-acetylase-like acetyltransferase